MTEHIPNHRPIRTYVRREGRLTRGQQRALDELFPRFGIDEGEAPLDFETLFGRRAPVILDIGFGDGEALAELAAAHPEQDFVGVEVHRPGVGHLLLDIDKRGLANVRVAVTDGVELLRRRIPDTSLAGINLFFPDPWPKKRHHKRRMVQPSWLRLAATKLQVGGHLHMATDWSDYAEHMLAAAAEVDELENRYGPGAFAPGPGERPVTKFEQRGRRKGHQVWDLVLEKRED